MDDPNHSIDHRLDRDAFNAIGYTVSPVWLIVLGVQLLANNTVFAKPAR